LDCNPTACTVTIAGAAAKLSPSEFAVFSLLAAEPGRIVSRDEIMSSLYTGRDAEPCDAIVSVFVAKLRRKLEAVGGFGVIGTARLGASCGRGYFVGLVDGRRNGAPPLIPVVLTESKRGAENDKAGGIGPPACVPRAVGAAGTKAPRVGVSDA
jgi:hypothetical protein